MSGDTQADSNQKSVRVWDLPTRLFHWLLVLSLAGSWWSAEAGIEWMEWHFRFGYFAAGLIIFRLIWGLVGTRHARFSGFLFGPDKILAHLRTLGKRQSVPTTGHNPLGGLVVLLMLIIIGAQVSTGLFASDDIFTDGPFHPLVSDDLAGSLTSWHHRLFTAIQIIAGVHIAAILFYWVWKRQQLIWPMITGRKPWHLLGEDKKDIGSKLLLGVVVALVAAGIVYGAISMAPEPAMDEFY